MRSEAPAADWPERGWRSPATGEKCFNASARPKKTKISSSAAPSYLCCRSLSIANWFSHGKAQRCSKSINAESTCWPRCSLRILPCLQSGTWKQEQASKIFSQDGCDWSLFKSGKLLSNRMSCKTKWHDALDEAREDNMRRKSRQLKSSSERPTVNHDSWHHHLQTKRLLHSLKLVFTDHHQWDY